MPTAWALLAVSSDQQSGTLRHQRAWAEATAAEKGWQLSRIFEGVDSGRDGPRKLTRDLLIDIQATPVEARPQFILMIRLDRVGRGSIVDSQIFVRDLLAVGARVFTRDAGEIRLDSALDELIAAVQVAVARHENDVRRDKLKALYRRRRGAGEVVSNRVAYGLALDESRHLVAQQTHKATIRKVYEMRASGKKVADIARWLTTHAPPHIFRTVEPYDVCWSDSRVARLIQNRAYIGPVVGEELWLKAQRTPNYVGKAPREVRKNGVFPLGNGVLRCACGRGMSAELSNVERNASRGIPPNRYYVCKASWNHSGSWPHHRAIDVEDAFIEFLRRIADEPAKHVQRRSLAEAGATLKKLDEQLRRLRSKLAKIDSRRSRVWWLDDAGHLDAFDLAARLQELNDEKGNLMTAIVRTIEEQTLLRTSIQRDKNTEELYKTCLDEYLAGDDTCKQSVARAVAASFGGLRLTLDCRILTGTGIDSTPNRRLRHGEIWRVRAVAWPPEMLSVRELAALKKLPPLHLAGSIDVSVRGLQAILNQRRRPRGWRLVKLRKIAAAIPPALKQKDVRLTSISALLSPQLPKRIEPS